MTHRRRFGPPYGPKYSSISIESAVIESAVEDGQEADVRLTRRVAHRLVPPLFCATACVRKTRGMLSSERFLSRETLVVPTF